MNYLTPASPYAQGGSMFGNSAGLFTSQVDYRDFSRLSMQWGFAISSYTYADDRFRRSTHYLRGRIGMKLSLWVSLQFQTGPRSLCQINIYADYVL